MPTLQSHALCCPSPFLSRSSAAEQKSFEASTTRGVPRLKGERKNYAGCAISSTMSAYRDKDPRVDGIASSIRVVPNFPKPGIMFQDITTLLLDPKAFKNAIDLFVERYKGKNISVVAGIEARGFIFGPPIALAIGAKFVPLRKPRKLPGEVISEKYVLEYGTDCLEMHIGAAEQGDRALVVDDLIATGGTLLERRYGGKQLYASEDDDSVNHSLVRDLDADAVRLEQFGAELEADE